ncbi:MAG TPA: twin-arginine translocase subunit TatC [Saprospiraceae bacterium]|nr:twin-arginine translocase subunit TatC [Saprospiraceae bacterium]
MLSKFFKKDKGATPVAEGEGAEMGFLDHLDVLRKHLFKAAFAMVAVSIIVFLSKDFVFNDIIFAPKNADFPTYKFFCNLSEVTCFHPPDFKIMTIVMGEQFFVHIKVSIWLGFTFAFPYIFYQFWSFIKPGLYQGERKAARGLVLACSSLFVLGVLFGYYVISPFAITWLAGYSVGLDAVNSPSLDSYVNYLTMFTLPAGIMFELPVLIYFVAKIGLVSADFLSKYRRHAIIVILIVAAIITPPDVVTQLLIGTPVLILYEVGILVARRVNPTPKESQTS